MTENKRFNYSNTHGWRVDAFLKVMNGLDDKNKILKERIQELEEENERMKGAFKRKFDYDIEDVVDEICDEDW